jgi:ubiquinone/menaquinone biosynthesis C-methylase UbiE
MLGIEEKNTLTLSILEEAPAYHRLIFERIKPWLGKRILEVGCGTGNLTRLLLRAGEVIASDINPTYLQIVEKKFHGNSNLKELLHWDAEKDTEKEGFPVDTILCSNVLEHIKNDELVLKKFYRLLPQKGKLILLVPALKILYNSFDKGLGHFRRYDRKELIQKLKGSHFSIYRLNYFNFFGIFGWFINGTLLQRNLLPVKQVRIFNQLVPFIIHMERFIPPPIGQSLIAVGEKV